MRAIVIGGGMAGLFSAIALREAGDAFAAIDVYEQTEHPTTAGAGLNIAPNGARLCHWLGIDLDGGDPRGPAGVQDGGRAAILDATRMILPDMSVSVWPFDYNAPEKIAEGGGFHHMHRQDLLMCLHKRAAELGPDSGVRCPISVHMGKRLAGIEQDENGVTATFEDGGVAVGDVLIGADGIHSKVLQLMWPGARKRRWTGSIIFRGTVPKAKVATLRKRDGSPLDFSPYGVKYHDMIKRDDALCMSYWIRGGELLNVAITWYEPDSLEFPEDWADWRPIESAEVVDTLVTAWDGDPRAEDVIALGGAIERPTKWGLYDRDALDEWQQGRVCVIGDAAHPMLPTFGQGASQSFEDGAALSKCFALHGGDVRSALLHYERVRHYRATRFQFGSKAAFKQLEPEDTAARRQILAATDERDMAIFDHEQRAGNDDSWIYDYDARQIGDRLPPRRLGPWDFRSKTAGAAVRKDIYKNLWKPDVPRTGDTSVTRQELQRHNTFDDCWVVIRGKVYDFTEWKTRHPGGSFVARLFAGKDATGEFGDFHSRAAIRHMENFCVGPYVGDGPLTGDAMIRAAQNTLPVPDFESTAFVAAPPLSAAVVAIVTTAGLHHADEPGWAPGTPTPNATWRADQSFRILDRSRRDYVMAHWSPNIDRVGFAADHNVVFPIDRLEEMVREGVIKDVAEKHIAFVGAQGNLSTIRYDSGPAAAQFMKGIGVNLVLLTAVCPTCTRTVGTLAHVFEAEGIATVGISLVRGQTERLRPPRFLYCEFPFGRPLGKPGDPHFQRRVLDSAFALLARPQGPVLEDFPEVIDDESGQPLTCTIPPRFNPDLPAAVDEALALRPAYERQLAASSRTSVGRVMNADQVGAAVAAFVKIAEGTPWDSAGLPGNPADTALDLRSYYEEAALALSDHVPAAKAAESWIYQTTELGRVFKRAQVKMAEAGLSPELWNQIVPINQLDQGGRQEEFERIKIRGVVP